MINNRIEFPKKVKCAGTILYLNEVDHDGYRAWYYIDNGAWGVWAEWRDGKLYSLDHGAVPDYLKGVELFPIPKKVNPFNNASLHELLFNGRVVVDGKQIGQVTKVTLKRDPPFDDGSREVIAEEQFFDCVEVEMTADGAVNDFHDYCKELSDTQGKVSFCKECDRHLRERIDELEKQLSKLQRCGTCRYMEAGDECLCTAFDTLEIGYEYPVVSPKHTCKEWEIEE